MTASASAEATLADGTGIGHQKNVRTASVMV